MSESGAAQPLQSVKVAVRVRGLVPRERLQGSVPCVAADDAQRRLTVGRERSFEFDHVFGPAASQAAVYADCVAPTLRTCLQGLNLTVFAYGAPRVHVTR